MSGDRASTGSARTDSVFIEGLKCSAHVGVPESERKERQTILVDLELSLDLTKAGKTGSVEDTVDYAAVAREVKALAEGRPFILVEQIAESAAEMILWRFKVKQVRVRIRKFSVPGSEAVGVEIVRPSTSSGRT